MGSSSTGLGRRPLPRKPTTSNSGVELWECGALLPWVGVRGGRPGKSPVACFMHAQGHPPACGLGRGCTRGGRMSVCDRPAVRSREARPQADVSARFLFPFFLPFFPLPLSPSLLSFCQFVLLTLGSTVAVHSSLPHLFSLVVNGYKI